MVRKPNAKIKRFFLSPIMHKFFSRSSDFDSLVLSKERRTHQIFVRFFGIGSLGKTIFYDREVAIFSCIKQIIFKCSLYMTGKVGIRSSPNDAFEASNMTKFEKLTQWKVKTFLKRKFLNQSHRHCCVKYCADPITRLWGRAVLCNV